MGKNRWGPEGAEALYAESPDEAIQAILDDWEDLTGTVEVCEYAPDASPDALWVDSMTVSAVAHVIDDLNDDNGVCYEGMGQDYDAVPVALVAKLREAVAAICAWYPVTMMSQTGRTVTVDVHEWCVANAPEWLEQIDRKGSSKGGE